MTPTGIEVRHQERCATLRGGRCNCERSYRGNVWDRARGRPIWGPRGTSQAEAVAWRAQALSERKTAKRADAALTARDAWDTWYAGALAGTISNRRGERYKPSALRGYERAWRLRIDPELGPTGWPIWAIGTFRPLSTAWRRAGRRARPSITPWTRCG